MKLCVIGDIHASHDNIKDTTLGMNSLIQTLEDNEVQYLLISGDIFHDFNIGGKESSFGSVFNSVNVPLNDWLQEDEKRKIIMIPGNHDMSTDKNQKDALTAFDFKPRIYVSHEINNYNLGGGVNIITLPWMYPSMYKDKEELLLKIINLKDQNKDGINILLGHCEVEGSELPNHHIMFGGNFKFTKNDLSTLGFNIIALGHIHKQQDYYIGTPWQHDFGESNFTGNIKIITILAGKVYENRIIELKNTAKYHNINVDDIDKFICHKQDYVKVKGKKLDKILPDNYIFEKDKEIIKIEARTNASITDSVETLLIKYLKDKNIEVDIKELMEILNKIDINDSYLPSGSLDKFEYITLTNIGPHKNTHIKFNDPLLAISGMNGVGKTIFLEAMFAALYGKFPSYGNISDLSDNGTIETELSTNTGKYKIIRKTNKSGNKAFIYKDNTLIVGPKIKEVNEYIRKLIGPEELLLSSVFSTQFSSGDIVDLEPSDRKDIFHKLLGLNFILDIKDKIDIKLNIFTGQKETIINQIGNLSIENLKERIETHKDVLINSSDKLQENTNNLEEYNKEHKNLTISSSILVDKAMEKHKLEEEWKDILKQIKDYNLLISNDFEKEFEIKSKEFNEITKQLKNKSIKLSELLTINNDISENTSKMMVSKDIDAKITTKLNKISMLQYEIKKVKDVGCKDKPLPCKFIDTAINAPIEIDKLTKESDILDKERNKINIELNDENIRLIKKQQKCEKLVPKVDEDKHGILHTEVLNLELKIHNSKENKIVLKQSKNKEIEIKSKISKLDNIDESEIQISADKLHDIEIEIKKIEELITHYKISIATTKKELEFCKKELMENVKYELQLKKLNNDIDKISILSKAFGKDGIPQLIINSALPQLQDILNILTKYINKFSIQVSTQEKLKSGGTKETIGFIVDDGIKKRDVKYFSGGEKKLLKSLIRLSLSIFLTQRTNRNYKVLFMDEAFDALDKSNALLLLRILHNLSGQFNQIFIVSHFTDILDKLPNCIKFEKTYKETIVR